MKIRNVQLIELPSLENEAQSNETVDLEDLKREFTQSLSYLPFLNSFVRFFTDGSLDDAMLLIYIDGLNKELRKGHKSFVGVLRDAKEYLNDKEKRQLYKFCTYELGKRHKTLEKIQNNDISVSDNEKYFDLYFTNCTVMLKGFKYRKHIDPKMFISDLLFSIKEHYSILFDELKELEQGIVNKEQELSIEELAIFYAYENPNITDDEAMRVLVINGYKSLLKFKKRLSYLYTRTHRTGERQNDTKKTIQNRLKQFRKVYALIENEMAKSKMNDEIKQIEALLAGF